MLLRKDYQLRYADDNHALAWDRIIKTASEGGGPVEEATDEVMRATREAARRNLSRFSGRRREVDGRPYIYFGEYAAWRGRSVKGNLKASVEQGLVAASWNAWVEAAGGKDGASLAGVKVGMLSPYIANFPVQACGSQQEAEQKVNQRRVLLERLQKWTPHDHEREGWLWARTLPLDSRPFDELVGEWRQRAAAHLTDLHALRQAADAIGRQYFDGHKVFFTAASEGLGSMLEAAAEMATVYNEQFAPELERNERWQRNREEDNAADPDGGSGYRIDLDSPKKDAPAQATVRTRYLIDFAKAEVLDWLGERPAAASIVEKYL